KFEEHQGHQLEASLPVACPEDRPITGDALRDVRPCLQLSSACLNTIASVLKRTRHRLVGPYNRTYNYSQRRRTSFINQ
ncbi:hypothetical protein V1523DRAFT_351643, partial [Lipomyces doorenjongii]